MRRLPASIWLALVLAACDANGPVQISTSGYGAYEVSLAALDTGLAVAWHDTRDGNAEIYLRLLDPETRAAGAEVRLSDDPEQSYEVDLARAGDAIAVTWYDQAESGALSATLALWQPGLGIVWRTPLGSEQRARRNPVVRATAERIFVAWIEAADDTEEFASTDG